MGWKKFILGEKMPDKNDPQYAQRYKKEVKAGRKFARCLKIDKAAERVQRFACKHPRWFLAIVFGIVLGCLSLNIYRVAQVCNRQQAGGSHHGHPTSRAAAERETKPQNHIQQWH